MGLWPRSFIFFHTFMHVKSLYTALTWSLYLVYSGPSLLSFLQLLSLVIVKGSHRLCTVLTDCHAIWIASFTQHNVC